MKSSDRVVLQCGGYLLPHPPSKFQRSAFQPHKRSFCSSRWLWPTLVWLTWYSLLASRKL